MPSYKRRPLFFLAIIMSVATTMAALRGHNQQDTNSSKKEDATLLQTMTERQRQHSKLYERPHRKDLRKTKESTQVVFTTPFVEADDEKMPPTVEELLQWTICSADAVVIGMVETKTSQFTEDGGFIFTDYDVRVNEVVRNNVGMPIQGNGRLVFTGPGGAVAFDGKVVRIIDKSFEPLLVGHYYLLFLKRVSATGSYQAVNSNSSFELEQNKVRRLSAKELPYLWPYHDDAASFLAQIRAIANLCDTQSKGDAK